MKPIFFGPASLFLFTGLLVFAGCPSSRTVMTESPPFQPAHRIVLLNGDTLAGTITDGEVMRMRVATANGDTLGIENETVSRVLVASSGADITGRYIDPDLIAIQKARLDIDTRQTQLKAEVDSGKRRKTDWTLRTTFALVLVKLERTESDVPELSLTLYNFGEKAITLFKAKVFCLDENGVPTRRGGKDHIFEASSPVQIEPGENFTTKLRLVNHPEARNAKVQITYAEFADRTWWRGKMEMGTL
jgi:hypothetical protein